MSVFEKIEIKNVIDEDEPDSYFYIFENYFQHFKICFLLFFIIMVIQKVKNMKLLKIIKA